MKKPILILFLLAFALIGKAQTPTGDPDADELNKVTVVNPIDTTVFAAVQEEPNFSGGIDKFYQYLQSNLKTPAGEKVIGKATISFIVEKDGSLTGIKMVSNLGADINTQIIQLMKSCPKWNAGVQNGKTVRVYYDIPIMFSQN